ncbi:MAG: transketolase [Candidatus Babeliales bacterium]|jgi:transketolase
MTSPNHLIIKQPSPLFKKLATIAQSCRADVVDMLTRVQSSHLGCCFSVIDILVVLYHHFITIEHIKDQNPQRDIVILSKGHSATALYAVLASVGLIPRTMLEQFHHGFLAGHPVRNLAYGIEASTGSLGHGLSLGVGLARAAKDDQRSSKIYVIVGDGECQEGALWEALTMASRFELNNLTVIVDRNNLQGFDRVDVIDPCPLAAKFEAFGCTTMTVDGHDYDALIQGIARCTQHTQPTVIIAQTVKGKGLPFIEDKLEWHYRSLKPEQYQLAQQILGSKQ